MIYHLPMLYTDELLYSLFARYVVKNGYVAYRYAAEDLFVNKTDRPDIEFTVPLNPNFLETVSCKQTLEKMILEHTMYPYYARFLPTERRQGAWDSFLKQTKDWHNLLAFPKKKKAEHRFLRYCPICAQQDRVEQGETYWHRIHQMRGISICPIHFCDLVDTNIEISGKSTPALIAAEMVISQEREITICTNPIEIRLAQYMAEIFQAPINRQKEMLIKEFFHSKLVGTKYLSARGGVKRSTLLHKDFMKFYAGVHENWLSQYWRFQKVFEGTINSMYDICMLALFLDISTEELLEMEVTENMQTELFDAKVLALREQGYSYPAIAKELNVSVNLVKPIGEVCYGSYRKTKNNPQKGGRRAKDYFKLDAQMLPEVKKIIRQLHGDGNTRPQKVAVATVERMLGLKQKAIYQMPLCLAEIRQGQESQEIYWAREVVWAVHDIQVKKERMNWKHIRNRTNLRRINFEACMPYLHLFVGNAMVHQIKSL